MDYHGHTSSSALLLQHLGFVDDEIYKGELDLPDDVSFDDLMNESEFIADCECSPVNNPEERSHQGRQSPDHLTEAGIREGSERPFNVPPWKGTVTFCVNKRDNERVDDPSKGRSYGPFSDDGFAGEFDDGPEAETFEQHLERIVKELDGLESDGEAVEYRDPTPALTAASSITPLTATSPPTPSNDLPVTTSSEKLPAASYNLKGKRDEAPSQGGGCSKKPVTWSSQGDQNMQKTRKRKQAATACEHERANQTRNGPARKKAKKTDEAFNLDFLMERYGFVSLHDDGQTWPCPFPRAASIGPKCRNRFDASGLYEHVNRHIAAFKVYHPGRALKCPLKARSGCKWGDKNRKQVKKIGPNETLARHIVDSHHKARRVQCPCGSIVGRGILDQVVRHLEGPGHTAKLEKKRRNNPDFPDYPNISSDRILLLQEQKLWGQVPDAGTDDDRQEGSSTGHKRARREV